MSTTTTTHEGNRASRRHNTENNTPRAEPQAEPTAPETENNAASDLGTATLSIDNLSVTVPVKFAAGHALTVNQARILDAAYQRQFVNNQTANAKARAEKYAKATTEAERATFAPLTAEQIAALYTDYEPAVGGAPRMGQIEKMRQDAAWRAWVAMVSEHNKSIAAGGPAVIERAGNKPVALDRAPAKTKDMSEDAHKAGVEAFVERKAAFLARFASLPQYAERIQIQLDAIEAERGAKKAAAPAPETVSGFDLA